jgi:NADPH:quinone reductase-like Zn-dependent oxidoreductase
MKLRYKIGGGLLGLLVVGAISLALVLSYNAPCEPAPEVADGRDTMQAVRYQCYGSSDVLEFGAVEMPEPAADEMLVRVHSASVNPLDWHFMRGSPYIMRLMSGTGKPADPRLGVDFAGTVVAVGDAVTRFEPGDEVFGGANGAFAEYVAIRESGAVALKPTQVTFEQAAAVPVAALTALQALRDKGRLETGQKVLINGASGGVGTFAVQIAKALGAEVSGVCSTRNVDMVRSIGADHVFDYKHENYTESDRRYDLIVDMIGNHSLSDNLRVLEPDGVLVLVGGGKGEWVEPLKRPLQALLVSPFAEQEIETLLARLDAKGLAVLAELMETQAVVAVIDRRYPLSDLASAIDYSESGRARGKIIINMNGDRADTDEQM